VRRSAGHLDGWNTERPLPEQQFVAASSQWPPGSWRIINVRANAWRSIVPRESDRVVGEPSARGLLFCSRLAVLVSYPNDPY
jgi:hypothetical protein